MTDHHHASGVDSEAGMRDAAYHEAFADARPDPGGKLIAVATTGAKRAAATPGVPTVAESGLPGFEATTWYAALFPAKTPPRTVQSMNRHLNAALDEAQLKSRLTELGFEVHPGSAEALARHMREEAAKWGKVVKSSGAQID